MPETLTPKLGLSKHSTNDATWGAQLNVGFDTAEARLTLAGTAVPNGNVAGHWVGQQYYRTNSQVLYVCSVATGVIAGSVWVVPGAAAAQISQELYDELFPINTVIVKRNSVDPVVPAGISATWETISIDHSRAAALAIRDSAAPGAQEGVQDVDLPNHVHSGGSYAASGTTAAESQASVERGSGSVAVAVADHTHTLSAQVTGNSGNPTTNPGIDMNPRVLIIRAWRRTA